MSGRVASALLLVMAATIASNGAVLQQTPYSALPTPGFHHLHLNSVNPETAVGFYTEQFPSTSATTFAGQPALSSPNNVLVLFNKVAAPPATQPPSAFWHFGWHVTDVHERMAGFQERGVTLLPLYTGDGGTVFVSSDTYPGTGGALGLTRAGVAAAKARGVKPTGGAGFAYLRGPDDALVEYQGDMAAERFNHVHMYQDQPYCAQLWYQSNLNVPTAAGRGTTPARTIDDCRVERGPDPTFPALDVNGTYRTPSLNSTRFGDVSLFWYMNQTGTPAVSTRGQLMDHIGLSVGDLDAWIAKFKAAGIALLEQPYSIGGHRAVMIEGPSREAIELVEIR